MFPDADVSTDPQSFIYDRTIGMDAKGTSHYVKLSVEEMKKQKLGSILKHFPGYGNNRDSHVEIVTDNRSMEDLRKNDFLPLKRELRHGLTASWFLTILSRRLTAIAQHPSQNLFMT